MKKFIFFVLILFLIFLPLNACKNEIIQKPIDDVKLQLKWIHQAQFAGFYIAKENGYYLDEGINLEFIERGNGVDLINPLINNEAQFSIISPEQLIVNRSKNINIKAIAAIYRRSPIVFVSMNKNKILKPADLKGKSISVLGQTDAEIQLYALLRSKGIDESEVKLMPWLSDYSDFFEMRSEITYAYITAGLIKMREKGYDVNFIWPGDYGINFYSDIIAAQDSLIEDNPDLVLRFLRASLKGWDAAIGNTEKAIEIVMDYAQLKDIDLQTKMMDAQTPLIHTGEDEIGWMKDGDWKNMHDVLFEQGLIDRELDHEDFYSMEFISSIYKGRLK